MGLIDTHTHLEGFAREGTLAAMLARTREAGVDAMITIGTSPDDWALYRGIAGEHPGFVHYSVGLHPCAVEAGWAEAMAQMEGFWGSGTGISPVNLTDHGRDARATRPVALGEIGLDRFHLPKDPAEAETIFAWQCAAFAAQLELAKR